MKIENCFDSHVHWPAIGEFAHRWDLSGLRSLNELFDYEIPQSAWREDWLIGFGWSAARFKDQCTLELLDGISPLKPVVLVADEGHCVWANSLALRQAGYNLTEYPSGILNDKDRHQLDKHIPRASRFERRAHLLEGAKVLNLAGFTHVRDMTCIEEDFNEAVHLDESGLLTLAVEEFFWLRRPEDLSSILATAATARRSQTPNLRVKGLKVFVDGALGSEGAWISKCYCHSTSRGQQLWTESDLAEVFLRSWESDFEVAVHVIGDAAFAMVVRVLSGLRQTDKRGRVHLEHVELADIDSICALSELAIQVQCHMQPSHWLGDHKWLKSKIGELEERAFPWRSLQEFGLSVFFGSDAPITPPSVADTVRALDASANKGVPRLLGEPFQMMSHPDLGWVPNCYTLFDTVWTPREVVFRGEHLL